MKRLGVDHGLARVGLAIADDESGLAHPLQTLAGKDHEALAKQVAARAGQEGASEIVVGLPLALDGSEGGAARRARKFADRVKALTALPVILWDERLTSAQAERALTEMAVRGARKREVVDQVAAALILQSYIDFVARKKELSWHGAAEPDDDPGSRAR